MPAPEAARPEQEVVLPGGGWWRGRTCPGAVVTEDPLVRVVWRTYLPLQAWHQVPWPGSWADQPAWWTAAMQIARTAMTDVDREETEP